MVHKHKPHHHRHPAAAVGITQAHPHGIKEVPSEAEMPQIAGNIVSWLQQLLMDAGFPLIGGADGKYGDSTHKALQHIAQEAKIDLNTVNFNDPNCANYKTFMGALAMHKHAHDPVVKALATGQPLVGSTPAPVIVPVAAVTQPDVPASIRGTEFDPRYLKTVSDAELKNILKDGLHGMHAIVGGIFGSYHRNGELGDVTSEKVLKYAHELLGIPKEQETLNRPESEALAAAMGMEVAKRNGLAPNMTAALDSARERGAVPSQGAIMNPQVVTGAPAPYTLSRTETIVSAVRE